MHMLKTVCAALLLAAPLAGALAQEAAPPAKTPITLEAAQLDALAGRYQVVDGPVVEMIRAGSTLVAKVDGRPDVTLTPASDTQFVNDEIKADLRFERQADGSVPRVQINYGGHSFTANRLP